MQNLYDRTPVSLPGWVTLLSDTNYRSPRDILARINQLTGLERPVTPGSPLAGSGVEILTYSDTATCCVTTFSKAVAKAAARF